MSEQNKATRQIGDIVETEAYGRVQIKGIFISPTTQERCYHVRELDEEIHFECLVFGAELL